MYAVREMVEQEEEKRGGDEVREDVREKRNEGEEMEGGGVGGDEEGREAERRSQQLCLIKRHKVCQEQRRQTDETKTINNEYVAQPSATQ